MSNQNAKVIFEYTIENAVEDGCLFNLSREFKNEVCELGINIPVYCSKFVYENYIDLTECAKKMLNDKKGRAWDILFMARFMMHKSVKNGYSHFVFYCVVDEMEATEITAVLKFDGYNFFILKDLSDD